MKRASSPLRAVAARLCRVVLAGVAACATAGAAWPQQVPYDIGNALKDVQPPRPVEPRSEPAPIIEEPEAGASFVPAGERLLVRRFQLEGAGPIDDAQLQAALDPFRDRELTMAEIERAAAAVTAVYRGRGYLLARTYVPRQDARDGTLRLRIVVGRVGRVTLHNRSHVRDGLLRGAFAPLEEDPAVTRARLERSMLVAGDFPGAALPKLTLSPSATPGRTDLDIDVDPGPRIGGYLLADNDGSRYTGRHRLVGDLHADGLLGLADRLALHGLDAQGGGLANGRAAYGLAVGADGLRAEIAWAKTTYALGSDYRDLGATGTARTLDATLSYPLLRSRSGNLVLSFNLARRRLQDEIALSGATVPKRARVGTLGLQYEQWDGWFGPASYAKAGVALTFGHLDIDDAAQRALNAAGADTAGDYARLNLAFEAHAAPSPRWELGATLSIQQVLVNRNLDTSEQMNIAGAGGVRAYRESVSGDNGYLLALDAAYALPAIGGWAQSVGPFADLGRVRLQQGAYAAENGTRLSDVGIGYTTRWRSFFAKLEWARSVGPRPAATPDGNNRLLVRAGAAF